MGLERDIKRFQCNLVKLWTSAMEFSKMIFTNKFAQRVECGIIIKKRTKTGFIARHYVAKVVIEKNKTKKIRRLDNEL